MTGTSLSCIRLLGLVFWNSIHDSIFIFHFQFPFLLCGFRILHLFYLHFLSSNNPLRNSTNNKIPFFPFIIQKDFFGFILILCLYLLQTHFGISSSLCNYYVFPRFYIHSAGITIVDKFPNAFPWTLHLLVFLILFLINLWRTFPL